MENDRPTQGAPSFPDSGFPAQKANSSILLASLQNPALYPHDTQEFEVLETHISWVLLTGSIAYKIKKPVNFGFVDFSTLEKRHQACLAELRLNRRLAPELYLAVVPLSGTPEHPHFGEKGTIFEYAVQMKQFPQEALLTHVLERGELTHGHIDQLARELANFHRNHADAAAEESPFGHPDTIQQAVIETFEQLPAGLNEGSAGKALDRLKSWMTHTHAICREEFFTRKREGRIRECHGDLHLGNMVLLNNRIVVFDGIDFSETLRWIDVINEIAFLLMDLTARHRPDFATRFLNRYLEWTGDYHGLKVLRYYEIYRAMVRAKVAGLRLAQPGITPETRSQLHQECQRYIDLGERLARPPAPGLIIMHGLSGSGKTLISEYILEQTEAIRIRSDIERKRLFHLQPDDSSHSPEAGGIYTPQATKATYQHLYQLAQDILDSGYPVLVDATFLHKHDRDRFRHLARQRNIPFFIVDIVAGEDVLRARIRNRLQEGRDASEATEAVLDRQLQATEPLEADERPFTMPVLSGAGDDLAAISRLGHELREKMRATPGASEEKQ